MMWPIMLFFVGSLIIGGLSWQVFSNPRSYGFYRFLAFEVIWAIISMNVTDWFRDVFSARQVVSWILLVSSLGLAMSGFYLLGVARGRPEKTYSPKDGFEHAFRLVKSGPYRYIRHPLYTSLILLAWGAALKSASFFSFFFSVLATGILYVTALAEEEDNIDRFGDSYAEYMARTRMFVPWLF